MRLSLALLLCALLSACASDAGSKVEGSPVFLLEEQWKKKEEEAAARGECLHVWEQIDTHAYRRVQDGMPLTDMCAVSRCSKCGRVRHECQGR